MSVSSLALLFDASSTLRSIIDIAKSIEAWNPEIVTFLIKKQYVRRKKLDNTLFKLCMLFQQQANVLLRQYLSVVPGRNPPRPDIFILAPLDCHFTDSKDDKGVRVWWWWNWVRRESKWIGNIGTDLTDLHDVTSFTANDHTYVLIRHTYCHRVVTIFLLYKQKKNISKYWLKLLN